MAPLSVLIFVSWVRNVCFLTGQPPSRRRCIQHGRWNSAERGGVREGGGAGTDDKVQYLSVSCAISRVHSTICGPGIGKLRSFKLCGNLFLTIWSFPLEKCNIVAGLLSSLFSPTTYTCQTQYQPVNGHFLSLHLRLN